MNKLENQSAGWGDENATIESSQHRQPQTNRLATIGILVFFAILVIGFFVWRQLQYSKVASVELNCRNISQAINARFREHGRPPGSAIFNDQDQPQLSWRVIVLPYLDDQDLYDRFDLNSDWDSATNRSLGDTIIQTYQSDRCERLTPGCTNWVAVLGDNTPIRFGRGTSRNEFTLTQKQIAFIEFPASDIIWTEPRDVTVAEAIQIIRASKKLGGLFCGLGDGSVIRVAADVSETELSRLLGN